MCLAGQLSIDNRGEPLQISIFDGVILPFRARLAQIGRQTEPRQRAPERELSLVRFLVSLAAIPAGKATALLITLKAIRPKGQCNYTGQSFSLPYISRGERNILFRKIRVRDLPEIASGGFARDAFRTLPARPNPCFRRGRMQLPQAVSETAKKRCKTFQISGTMIRNGIPNNSRVQDRKQTNKKFDIRANVIGGRRHGNFKDEADYPTVRTGFGNPCSSAGHRIDHRDSPR